MTPDFELLGRYAQTKSEDAFAELVRRHVNLVHSAALRQVNGDAHLAQDVAQTVFTDLAGKAGQLRRHTTLTGWLYTSTHFAAAKAVRTENRRRNREETFMREPIHENVPGADWEQLRPVLDEAMHELKETDREAILLRYFENRPFAEVGARLGLSENTARMRVERALEKLRAGFLRRGLTTTTALASVISANAMQTAPVGLAATLTTTSLAGVGTGTFFLLGFMTPTKLKLGFGALAVAGAATVLVVQHQTQTRLHAENEWLQRQIAQLKADNENLANRLSEARHSNSLTDGQLNELLRLRGEIARLHRQQNIAPESVPLETNQSAAAENTSIHVGTKFVSFPTEALAALGITWLPGAQNSKVGLLTDQQYKIINEAMNEASDIYLIGAPVVITANGREASMSTYKPFSAGGTNVNVGETLNVIPYFSANSSTFHLDLNAGLNQLVGDPAHPEVQNLQITNQVNLAPGQTVVMEKSIPDGGWLPDATNVPSGSRSFLVFVTPALVDSRDYIINRGSNTVRIAAMMVPPTNMDSRGFPKSQ